LIRSWDWNLDEVAEEQELGIKMDTWVIGFCLVVAGPMIYVVEWSTRDGQSAA